MMLALLLIYVLWHIWALLPLPAYGKWLLVTIVAACFSTEFLGFTGTLDKMSLGWASFFYNLGNKSIIILFYLLIAFILLDLGRLVRLVPRELLHDNLTVSIVLTVLMACIAIYGSIHYHHKQRVELTADSHGRLSQPLQVVMVSDLHIGYHNRRADLAKWIDLINSEHPDIILIAGDIVDFSMHPVFEEEMAAEFRRLEAPVYACLGNHEYFSDKQKAQQFYKDAGINLLVDSMVNIKGLTIIGRDDRMNPHRKPLSQFSIPDSGKTDLQFMPYTILLDHQPYNLEEAAKAGIDFQFSGHTHRGQIWPLSWITDAMYECSWGSLSKGKTQYYISSGLGIWGAKYRIGTQSEYVVLTIK